MPCVETCSPPVWRVAAHLFARVADACAPNRSKSHAGSACRLRRKLHGREIAVHALYNFVASFGGPAGTSSQRAWSRVADMLAGGTSHKA